MSFHSGFFTACAFFLAAMTASGNPIPAADKKIDSKGGDRSVESLIDLRGSDWRGAGHQPLTPEQARQRCALPLREHTGDAVMRVTVHYTGSKAIYKPGREALVKKLRSLYYFSTKTREGFKKNLWSDVPYHFYLDAYAQVAEARSTRYQVDSNTRYETNGHLSIVVEGDDGDKLSPAQKAKLTLMLNALAEKANVTSKKQIGVHGDFASTSCPGPELRQFVREYKVSRKDLSGSDEPVISQHGHGLYPELICPK